MKLMFASDIHGSEPCCIKLLRLFEAERPEKLILLGDLLYHGPRNPLPEGYSPAAVSRLLNGIKSSLLCVRGNCDAEVDCAMLDFPIMADYMTMWVGGKMFFCTHGHLFDSMNPDKMPFLEAGSVAVSGHTHIFGAHKANGIFRINPGSVSLPKNGNPKSCAVYKDGYFEILDMEGKHLDGIIIREH